MKKLIKVVLDNAIPYKLSDRNYKDNNIEENVWENI
jgi:hypothetical protein